MLHIIVTQTITKNKTPESTITKTKTKLDLLLKLILILKLFSYQKTEGNYFQRDVHCLAVIFCHSIL